MGMAKWEMVCGKWCVGTGRFETDSWKGYRRESSWGTIYCTYRQEIEHSKPLEIYPLNLNATVEVAFFPKHLRYKDIIIVL